MTVPTIDPIDQDAQNSTPAESAEPVALETSPTIEPIAPLTVSVSPAPSAPTRSRRKTLSVTQLAVLGLMIFAFIAADHISRVVFERLPHLEDEYAYQYEAKLFAGGHAYVTGNEPDAYFWQPFVIQYRQPGAATYNRFAKYTPGWPLVLSIGEALSQPWAVNAVLAMLSVGLIYRLGREIFDEAVGVVAALLLAISPMALLLNATLMSHVFAMFAALAFVYAYWRTIKHGRGRYRWAILSGLMLGMIASTRPVTAVAIAAPVALHALSRLLDLLPTLVKRTPAPSTDNAEDADPEAPDPAPVSAPVARVGFWPTLLVLVVMAISALPTTGLWPLYNYTVTGNWETNTYTLLWKYDKAGFCSDCGLNPGGHNLQYGWRNFRADINVWFRDLFGFTMFPGMEEYMRISFIWGAGVGLSWIPVLVGLFAGRKKEWVWFFFMFFVFIVIAGLLYWIGSVVRGSAAYSLRYYYEGTFGVCIVAAYGIVAWARSLRNAEKAPRSRATLSLPERIRMTGATFAGRMELAWQTMWPGYFILLVACGLSLVGYTPDRLREPLPGENRMWVNGLYGYNKVSRSQLDTLQAMRVKAGAPDKPVLLIILKRNQSDDDDWRDYGAAMALSSPYQNSDILVVRVFDPIAAPEMVRRFPDRLVLYQIGSQIYASIDAALAGG